MSEIRYALRSLRRTPGFTTAAVLTLALGIGATTAIVSTVDAVLLRPLPYDDPDGLVMVWEDASAAGFPRNTPAPANYSDWRDRNRVFQGMAATAPATANLTGDGAPEQVLGRRTTANFFEILGARPLLGRGFTEDEDRQNAPVVVISHGLWRRRYLGDPAIVGRDIAMNNRQVTVIGVMPEAFVFRNREMDFWMPMAFTPEQAAIRGNHFLNVVARFRPGVGIQQARGDMEGIAADLARQYRENEQIGVVLVPIREDVFGDTRQQLLLLTTAALCMLLMACANLAGLLLARGTARQRELATRAALGASRVRVVMETMAEGVVCAVGGGVAGLSVAAAGIRVLRLLVPVSMSASVAPELDGRVLGFALALSLLTGVVFTIVPALLAGRVPMMEAMRHGGRTTTGGRSRSRAALVTLQVAVTFVLLVAAGLMLRSLGNMRAFDVGFDSDGLLTMRMALPVPKYADVLRRHQFYDAVLEQVQALPGVAGAGFASTLPFTSQGNTAAIRVEGHPFNPDNADQVLFRMVAGGYLETLGVRLREGRLIAETDRPDSPAVVVVNKTLADRYWPGERAVGRRIAPSGNPDRWMTVTGVVDDVHENGYEIAIRPGIYVPSSQVQGAANNLVVRAASGDPLAIAPAVQRIISSVDPELPVAAVRTMNEILDLEVVDRRQQAIILGTFAALALVLASLGLYGLLSYSVAQRRREIGLRIVLGGTTAGVTRSIAGQGLALAGIGLGAGITIAFGSRPLMEGLLYGVQPGDPMTFVGVAVLLAAVASLACWIPAHRAARVNPQVVLQAE